MGGGGPPVDVQWEIRATLTDFQQGSSQRVRDTHGTTSGFNLPLVEHGNFLTSEWKSMGDFQ